MIDARHIGTGTSDGDGAHDPLSVHDIAVTVKGGDHLDAAGVTLPDGRVAVLIVVDDLGAGVAASTSNVNGSTVAGRVRSAYDSAKGL